jgi:phytoene synthase
LLAAFPIHAARGQLYIPLEILTRHGVDRQEARGPPATPQLLGALAELRLRGRHHLGAAQELLATAAPAVVPALLPVALAGPTLARMERRGYDPFVPVAIAPWRRQWLIWRAGRRPRWIFR